MVQRGFDGVGASLANLEEKRSKLFQLNGERPNSSQNPAHEVHLGVVEKTNPDRRINQTCIGVATMIE